MEKFNFLLPFLVYLSNFTVHNHNKNYHHFSLSTENLKLSFFELIYLNSFFLVEFTEVFW